MKLIKHILLCSALLTSYVSQAADFRFVKHESGSDGDIDGRIFRDTKYNYSVLYGMVDNKLIEDYNLIKEFIDTY